MNELIKIRMSMHLTREQFSKELNISKSFLEKIELGFKKPSRAFLEKLKLKYPDFDINVFFDQSNH